MKRAAVFGSTIALALVAGASLSTSAFAAPPDGNEPGGGNVPAQEDAPGHIIVFKKKVNAQDAANELESQHGLQIGRVYQHAIKGAFVSKDLPPQALAALERNPNVAYVEKNGVCRLAAQPIPTGIDRIDVEGAVAIDGTDDLVDVDIAILDTGIESTHPDLNVNHAMSVGFYYSIEGHGPKQRQVLKQSNDVAYWTDPHGHGTFVAGVAGAIDNDTGVVGAAPGARLTSVRVLTGENGQGTWAEVIAGLDYVAANSDTFEVANMSIGSVSRYEPVNDAVANTTAAGVVVVVAGGNHGDDAYNHSPASSPSAITVSALADSDGLPGGLGPDTSEASAGSEWEDRTMGADDTLAVFSNYGPLIDVAAPGVDIFSTWLDGGYVVKSGTSAAAPHVAGAVALYLSQHGRDRDDNGVIDGNDVALMELLVTSTGWQLGDFEYFSGDTDGYPEPLLNVANLLDFQIDQVPTVSITSPSDGAVLSGPVSLQANASDDSAVTQVEFFVDGNSLGVDSDPSDGYSLNWDSTPVSDGAHEISAVATDDALQASTSSISVSIDNIDSAPVADAGSDLTVQDSDRDGSEWVILDGSGSSDDRAIDRYEWYDGALLLSTAVSFTHDLPVGSHTMTLRVFDSIGQYAEDSVLITVEEAPAVATLVSVQSIAITGYGGKNGNNHLEAVATIRDDLGEAVVGAVVEAYLYKDNTMIKTSSGTSDSSGAALLFNERGIATGCYSVVITNVTAPGLAFDGVTPSNQHCKE